MHTAIPHTTQGELKSWLLEVLPGQGEWTDKEYLHGAQLFFFDDGHRGHHGADEHQYEGHDAGDEVGGSS